MVTGRAWSRTLVFLALFLCGLPALASHFRGGNVSVQVTEAGVATFTYETIWRKGSAFFPFDGVAQIRFYNPTDTARNSPLRTVSPNIGNTTVFRDVSDQAFDFRRQVVTVDLAALGLARGRYIARWENCCRIAGIRNAPEDSFSLETLVIYDGTRNSSPFLNSRILTVVGKGLPYSQNLNAFDPDGKPLTHQFLLGASRPTYGPTSHIPGITLDSAGLVALSAQSTATLFDINPFNPAGDYVFKVRVTDADGSFAERDVLLDVVATANRPPETAPIGNRVLNVGESLVLPLVATDPNVIDRVTLRTSDLPANMVFVQTPGNPATGTLAFRPAASQVGTFSINVEARDNGTPVLTDSELVTITVLDPNDNCPVLLPIGNREVSPGQTLTFTVSGADPDPGQTIAFSASFLPPGASFNPATRTFIWTPTAADVGVRLGTVFEVRDSAVPPCVDREVVGFSVLPANRFPVLDPIGDRAAAEGSTITFTVSGADPDGDAVEFGAEPLPVGAVFDPVLQRFTWRPSLGQAGVYEVTFRVTDSGSPRLSDQETVRISVARAGEESIQLLGLSEGQTVAGTLLVEAQVRSAFPTVSVEFSIDGAAVNLDGEAPFFLGPEVNGLPAGFDSTALADGPHVLTATAVDSVGQTLTTQRRFTTRNHVPPELVSLPGLLEGGVVSGTIFVEAKAFDDQRVASVAFAIDGTPVNTATTAPYFLNGTRIAQGTFDVSCQVCLRVGDTNDDLVVVAIEEDGTLARLCGRARRRASTSPVPSSGGGTGDGEPPAEEHVCDPLQGRAFGLCNAFCEAQDCDAPGKKNNTSCNRIRDNFARLTNEPRLPCENVGECIHHLTLGLISDPSQVATFDAEDFTGVVTTFELPFSVPLGFDTRALADGEHTLRITLTDNQGLTTTVEVRFFVQNAAPPADALRVSLAEPANGATFEQARLLPVTANVASAQGAVSVSFYAGGQLVATDTAAPFQTSVLIPEGGSGSLTLVAVARDSRGPRQSPAVTVGIAPRPVPPAPISVVDVTADRVRDGKIGVDTSFLVTLSRTVDPGSLGAGIRLLQDETEVPVSLDLQADGRTVAVTPSAPLEPDTLHFLIIDGVESADGARAPRVTRRFLTFPDIAIVAGQILEGSEAPIAGIPVRVGTVSGVTDERGVFELVGVPTGIQFLDIAGGVVGGRTYPPLHMMMNIRAGIDENRVERPIYLPALDLGGGLNVVNGIAAGTGILTSSRLSGLTLDLRGVTVRNGDGTPFTGRMSITPVPAPNVPMPPPVGVYSGSYVTIQPAVHFDPPAGITYPNLDGALPGEQIPLWHFDHGDFAWVRYGTGTVMSDGRLIVSNPGQGLPEAGWGSPQPPNKFTTVVGTVVDKEGSPLHGCRVVAGNIEGFSMTDGTFRLEMVPAGREGSPIQIVASATALDIEDQTYNANSNSVTAVQDGTTDLGEVKINSYGPILDEKIKLHAHFNDASQKHLLKVGSSHASEMRYKREVEELQKRLADLGFREGGSTTNHGQLLQTTGTYDEDNTKKAVRLFQSLELHNGNGGLLGGDGVAGKDTLTELNKITVDLLWDDVGGDGGVDYGCPATEVADGYGTVDMGTFLGNAATVAGNDVALPSGGNHPDHESHETGIDIDIPLPRNDNGGCAGSPGWGGGITVSNGAYDRDAMREILRRVIDTGASTRRWLNDTVLQGEMHNGVSLCSPQGGHDNHLHVRIDPSAVTDGVNAATAPLVANDASAGSLIKQILAGGAGEGDIPTDVPLQASLAREFDPTSLTAATVRLEGPSGAIQGDVIADPSGLLVTFDPVEDLDFATTYRLMITSGAVLAGGELLAAPSERSFTTEAMPSLRVGATAPPDMAERVPVDTEVTIRFDGPVDPTLLVPGAVVLRHEVSGAAVPVELSLTEDQTLLTLRPLAPLAEMSLHSLALAGAIRGADGSPLKGEGVIATFTTRLAPGLERVEIAPRQLEITRADLSDVVFGVTGVYANGSMRDLSNPLTGGTDYFVENNRVISVDETGRIVLQGNGEALVDVTPALDGYAATVRVKVNVFPEITFLGRQFALAADDDVALRFSERIDTGEVSVDGVNVADGLGNPVAGAVSVSGDGLTLTFDPAGLLPLRRDYTLRFNLHILDGRGVVRTFPRKIPFATAAENLGFELGDLTGFEVEGDVSVVQNLGSLLAPEGRYMAKLITSDSALSGRTSTLRAIDLIVPEGATSLKFIYNFLTDEVEQGSPFNDFFRASLVMPDGTRTTLLTVTRDQLRFSGSVSPVPGFDRMTGFRIGSALVSRMAGEPARLVFEALVSDAGDTSIDSAVLIDDIHFE